MIAELEAVATPVKIKQIDGLQILRAVAVFLVAWLHSGQIMDEWRTIELPHFAAFGIDIFFVVSGFIMSSILLRTQEEPGIRTMWGFLRRRLVRIFPIYWVFALLESARLLHGHGFTRAYLPGFLLLPRVPLVLSFSWTMVFEMIFYYTLSAILLVTVKRAVPVSIAFLTGAVFLSNPLMLEFVFGAVIALVFARVGKQNGLGIYLLLLGVLVSLFLRAYPEQGGAAGMTMAVSSVGAMRHVLTWGLSAALIVSGTVLWSPVIQTLPGKLAVVLGNASYSAYLASALVIEFTARAIVRGQATVGKVVFFQLAMVAAVFVAGWLSYQFVEGPMIRYLNGRK